MTEFLILRIKACFYLCLYRIQYFISTRTSLRLCCVHFISMQAKAIWKNIFWIIFLFFHYNIHVLSTVKLDSSLFCVAQMPFLMNRERKRSGVNKARWFLLHWIQVRLQVLITAPSLCIIVRGSSFEIRLSYIWVGHD